MEEDALRGQQHHQIWMPQFHKLEKVKMGTFGLLRGPRLSEEEQICAGTFNRSKQCSERAQQSAAVSMLANSPEMHSLVERREKDRRKGWFLTSGPLCMLVRVALGFHIYTPKH